MNVQKPVTRKWTRQSGIRFFEHENKGAEVAARARPRIHLSNDEVERIKNIILHNMRFHFLRVASKVTNRNFHAKAIYRYFRDAGEQVWIWFLLGLADLREYMITP